ncbi:MAG: hypothetical protein KIT72_19215 [Polyangiaceae bacterium]|nr:hypothetical protein [Polyangiaceae bacterium]MCW5792550.1 hypothetical protein [Polyangiaceae bacterium]
MAKKPPSSDNPDPPGQEAGPDSKPADPERGPAGESAAEASQTSAEGAGDDGPGTESDDAKEAPGGPEDSKDSGADEAEADEDAKGSQADAGGSGEAPPAPPAPPGVKGKEPAAWGKPLVAVDEFWTRFEMRLCVAVIAVEILALGFWVVLKSLSSQSGELSSNAGVVFRSVIGAVALGMAGYWLLKSQPIMRRRVAAITGVVIGLALGKSWANVGVEYSSNFLNWYQQASTLTLVGGLHSVGTRLTLLLALLGGSLATGAGKHVTIDVVTRMVSPTARKWMSLTGWVATSVICFIGSWGFFDHISIESFGARNTDSARTKVSKTFEAMGEHFFIARKQMSLDMKTLPVVLKGERYATHLSGAEWNRWLDESGMAARYGQEEVNKLKIAEDGTRAPLIVIPGKGEPRGELIAMANLCFPIGMGIIGLRFLLLSLLVVSGHRSAEPEEDFAGPQSDASGPEPPDPDGPSDEATGELSKNRQEAA